MLFPASRVNAFIKRHPELRYGQEFHQYMELHKCEQDRIFCDQLYQADGEVAKSMIDSRIDWEA
jgi:hypothetical protein